MMQQIQAALFDLDGTLTNTLQDIADAMNRALLQHGLPTWTTEEYKYLVGDGVKILSQRAVRERQDLAGAVRQTYQDWYGSHNQVTTRPYAGIPEMLAALKAQGIRLACCPTSRTRTPCMWLRTTFRMWSLTRCAASRRGIPVKPDPTGALAIAQAMGVSPSILCTWETPPWDMCCARRAGMHPVGVLWGFRKEAELRESGAEAVLHHPMELMDLLK